MAYMSFRSLFSVYILFGVLVVPQMVAASTDSCLKTLMSKPYCVSRVNASRVCSSHGATNEGLNTITKCMSDYSSFYKSGAVRGIQAVCLGGFTETGIVKDDSSNCGK